jgi:CHAD domain-containing protein
MVRHVEITAEHERKLDAPDGFELPDLGGSPLESRVFTSVYYDVPDHSLARAGITLRRRTERGRSVWQLKLPQPGDLRLELEQLGGPGEAPAELRALLGAHLRNGSLEPIAELRTRRRGELVARNDTTAEVTLDEVAVMDALRVAHEFVEVEIELRSGDPTQLKKIADEVRRAGAKPSSGTPKVFRALGLLHENGPAPTEPFEALRALLRTQLGAILRHDPGTRLGTDPESLHDMRVGVRRARALLRAGRSLIGNDTQMLRAELKWLGGVLGAVRDLDVLIDRLRAETAELDDVDRQAAGQALRTLERRRKRERKTMLDTLDGDRYLRLLDRFETEIEALEPTRATASLGSLARRELKKLRRDVEALPEDPPDEQLHALRKRGKRARYAAELAGKKRIVTAAKGLQDVLGDHQDAVVAEQRLRELALDAPPATALAAGRLVERERGRKHAARASWPRAWRKLRRAAK